MKAIVFFLIFLLSTSAGYSQEDHKSLEGIEQYFGEMLEQEKWDFGKDYNWSFYLCANDVKKLVKAKQDLLDAGFTNFEVLPNSMGQDENGEKLSMLMFEKSGQYIPQNLFDDITLFYSLEKNYDLSSFDSYGSYELLGEVIKTDDEAHNKSRVF